MNEEINMNNDIKHTKSDYGFLGEASKDIWINTDQKED